ncbi:MAG: putative protein kinase domain protein, partial [Streblomastix strix]
LQSNLNSIDLSNNWLVPQKDSRFYNNTITAEQLSALALAFLHSNNQLHQSLKPTNILIDEDLNVKLGDFGVAPGLSSQFEIANIDSSTYSFLSPEVISAQPYSQKADIWAFGAILYTVAEQRWPFDADSYEQLASQIMNNQPQFNHLKEGFTRNLILKMLDKDPEKRPTAEQIISYSDVVQNAYTFQSYISSREKKIQQKKSQQVGFDMGQIRLEQERLRIDVEKQKDQEEIIRLKRNEALTLPINTPLDSGIIRCEILAFGVMKASLQVPYPCKPTFSDNVIIYWGDGIIQHQQEEIKGNMGFDQGDVVVLELNTKKGTLHLFKNNQQQPVYVREIKGSVKFFVYLFYEYNSFTIISLKQFETPTAITLKNEYPIDFTGDKTCAVQ